MPTPQRILGLEGIVRLACGDSPETWGGEGEGFRGLGPVEAS